MAKAKSDSPDHLYMQVSDGIEKMIAEEVLRIGDKLPSVRVLSDEYGISMGTAFQAYYHLEGRGLIEARPKSGYYVRFNHHRFPQLPEAMQPDAFNKMQRSLVKLFSKRILAHQLTISFRRMISIARARMRAGGAASSTK